MHATSQYNFTIVPRHIEFDQNGEPLGDSVRFKKIPAIINCEKDKKLKKDLLSLIENLLILRKYSASKNEDIRKYNWKFFKKINIDEYNEIYHFLKNEREFLSIHNFTILLYSCNKIVIRHIVKLSGNEFLNYENWCGANLLIDTLQKLRGDLSSPDHDKEKNKYTHCQN